MVGVGLPALHQAGQRAVKLGDEASPAQDGQSESKRHGHVRRNAPDEIVFSTPGRRREDDADGDSKQAGESLLHPLALDEADHAGDHRDGRGRDKRWQEVARGHKNDDEKESGRGGFNEAACAAQGS